MYASPIPHPGTPVAHPTTGLAIYAYLPMNPCRLPQPSPADLVFFTDAPGESALTPITIAATLQLTHTEGHYHMYHTTYGASLPSPDLRLPCPPSSCTSSESGLWWTPQSTHMSSSA